MCESCLEGFNSTVFAYGQTGAGKTFTMQGHDSDGTSLSDESRGLIPRVFDHLFKRIKDLKSEGVEVGFFPPNNGMPITSDKRASR